MGVAMIAGQQGTPTSQPLDTPSTYIEGLANVACEAKHAVACACLVDGCASSQRLSPCPPARM